VSKLGHRWLHVVAAPTLMAAVATGEEYQPNSLYTSNLPRLADDCFHCSKTEGACILLAESLGIRCPTVRSEAAGAGGRDQVTAVEGEAWLPLPPPPAL
jgi:hypothetical protein